MNDKEDFKGKGFLKGWSVSIGEDERTTVGGYAGERGHEHTLEGFVVLGTGTESRGREKSTASGVASNCGKV